MFNPVDKIKEFIQHSRRVMMVATKPEPEEFRQSAKIITLGFAVIGVIGFVIFVIFAIIGPLVGGI